jgi:hypothetical protein
VNAILHRIRAGESIHIQAHSQGGAITSLALHRAARVLADEGIWQLRADGSYLVTGVVVDTYGSAAPAWPRLVKQLDDGSQVSPLLHFVHVRDATPTLLGINVWNWESQGIERTGGGTIQYMDSDDEGEYWGYVEDVQLDDLDVSFTDLRPASFHAVEKYTRLIW